LRSRYSILTAADGYEAIRILPDHRVSLLITDLKMRASTVSTWPGRLR